MLIKNETNLSNMEIGKLIDIVKSQDKENTHFHGQIEVGEVVYKEIVYVIQIRYLKRYVEWRIYERKSY